MTSKLSFGSFEWRNCMKQKKMCWKECNFTFAKLNLFNKHMKRQHYLALGRHKYTLFGQLNWWNQPRETKKNYLQLMQFYICKIKHIWYTHGKTTCLTLGRHTITIFGQLMKPTIWNKGKLNAINAILHS